VAAAGASPSPRGPVARAPGMTAPGKGPRSRSAQGARASGSLVHTVDARAKILGFVAFTVVVVTTPPQPAWPFVLYALLLAFVAALARVAPSYIAKRSLVVLPFIVMAAVFLPFFHRSGTVVLSLGGLHVTQEGLLIVWNAAAKALLGVISMVLLTGTTTFAQLVEGFERLHTPKVLVLTVTFMHRYGYLFLEESRRMQRAMASRNYHARWLGNVSALGHMLGSLFVRSYTRGERVYVAMVSRGYEGTMSLQQGGSFRGTDALFLASLLLPVIAIRVTAGMWGS
jgi:cobalt/nickel transport system permease protein